MAGEGTVEFVHPTAPSSRYGQAQPGGNKPQNCNPWLRFAAATYSRLILHLAMLPRAYAGHTSLATPQ